MSHYKIVNCDFLLAIIPRWLNVVCKVEGVPWRSDVSITHKFNENKLKLRIFSPHRKQIIVVTEIALAFIGT